MTKTNRFQNLEKEVNRFLRNDSSKYKVIYFRKIFIKIYIVFFLLSPAILYYLGRIYISAYYPAFGVPEVYIDMQIHSIICQGFNFLWSYSISHKFVGIFLFISFIVSVFCIISGYEKKIQLKGRSIKIYKKIKVDPYQFTAFMIFIYAATSVPTLVILTVFASFNTPYKQGKIDATKKIKFYQELIKNDPSSNKLQHIDFYIPINSSKIIKRAKGITLFENAFTGTVVFFDGEQTYLIPKDFQIPQTYQVNLEALKAKHAKSSS